MVNFSKYPIEERPLIGIFSQPDILGISLTENLLANFFRVIIFSNEEKKWKEKTLHINNQECLKIVSPNKYQGELNYAIFNSLDVEKEFSQSLYKVIEFTSKNQIRTLAIYSYKNEILKNYPSHLPGNLGIIYLGDLIGPRMELNNVSESSRIINEALNKQIVTLHRGKVVHPLAVFSVCKLLVKWLFSFGPFGEEIAIISAGIREEDFFERIKRFLPAIKPLFREDKNPNIIQRNIKKQILPVSLDVLIKDTIDWFKIHQAVYKKEIQEFLPSIPLPKWPIRIFLSLVVLFFISPFIFLLISGLSLFISKNLFLGSNLIGVNQALALTKKTALLAKGESEILLYLPLVGNIYQTTLSYSNLTYRIANIGLSAKTLSNDFISLSEKIFGDDIYNPEEYSNKLSPELESLYQEISFLQSDLAGIKGIGGSFITKMVQVVDLDRVKQYLLTAKDSAKELPNLLGKKSPQTYLVLLQNNMELRPTGGFIGSFGLITFDGGRLGEISVSDVYTADGQLRGHVEPPAPIKEYLKEANWYLRDANWDPDFPTSANKIEWFLDKEIDKKVDGVIAIDLNFARLLLKELGPIKLTDFNQTIDDQNLYEITQSQVEKDFFPGSYQKTNFMTVLTREMLARIMSLRKGEYLNISKAVLTSLEEKYIQIYLHNNNLQSGISSLGWDGGVKTFSCQNNCLADWLGIVEANVGVNKANYYLKRQGFLTINLNDKTIERNLIINYQNTANPSLGAAGIYKVFLRPLISNNSVVLSSKLISGETTEDINPRLDGYYFEVSPGQSRSFSLTWKQNISLDFTQTGEYHLFWRKQAGTFKDGIKVTINLPKIKALQSLPEFTLTPEGSFEYNTVLSRDFNSRILWK